MSMNLELTEKEFTAIRDFIQQNYGINLGPEKKTLVYSRLRTTLQEMNMKSFGEYFEYLKKDKTGASIVKFIDKITTNHTFFMREADHFDYFRKEGLPYIESAHGAKKDLRFWCAACSSGEEAYQLQMLATDYFESKPGWNTELLATDISSKVLLKAARGIYTTESIEPIPQEWKRKYFKRLDDTYSVVQDKIKKNIIFRKFNLMEERYHFRQPFQVIFCRNVMIYFDAETRTSVVNRFFDVLEPGGYLFIGHSESLGNTNANFKYVMPAVYRKPKE